MNYNYWGIIFTILLIIVGLLAYKFKMEKMEKLKKPLILAIVITYSIFVIIFVLFYFKFIIYPRKLLWLWLVLWMVLMFLSERGKFQKNANSIAPATLKS